MLNLQIIIGSTRPGRAADPVISWIVPVARAHGGFDVEVADLAWWGTTLRQARSAGTLPPAAMRLRTASEGTAR